MQRYLTMHAQRIAAIMLGIFTVVQVFLAWDDALIFDEVAHIGAGVSYVTQWDYRLNPEHPPLLKILAGALAAPFAPPLDTTAPYWHTLTQQNEYDQWAAGRAILWGDTVRSDRITFAARSATIIISVALGVALFLWARALGGALAGLLTLALYLLSPLVLAHSHYVTTDSAIALGTVLTLWRFTTLLQSPTRRNTLLFGGALGIALTAKFSSLLLLPLLIVATAIAYHCARRRIVARTYIRAVLAGMACAGFIVYLVYAPFTLTMPRDTLAKLAPARLHQDDSITRTIRTTILTLNNTTATRPLAMYLYGIGYVRDRISYGNDTYFFGEVHTTAPHAYFPTVFLIKEPVGFLAFIGVALFVTFAQQRHALHYRTRTNGALLLVLATIGGYSVVAISGNLAIGERHLMPIIPLLHLAVGVTLARALRRRRTCACKGLAITVVALLLLIAYDVVRAFPYYLSYFNQTVGGPMSGQRYVTDSNADWGQDAKRLARYVARHPEITKIRVDYFGGDDLRTRLGDRYVPWWDARRPLETGYYAISANTLRLSAHNPHRTPSYRFLLTEPPIARVGTSIFIYLLDGEEDLHRDASD